MSYYFTTDSRFKENRKKISFRFLGVLENFISSDGVFSKDTLDYGSRTLLETIINDDIKGNVLDLGCGIGVIGILLKKYHPDISLTLVDINENAVELAKENSELYKQDNKSVASNGLEKVNDKFDLIVFNPPIRTGKENIFNLYQQAMSSLNEDGRMVLVIRKQQGAQSTIKFLQSMDFVTEVINKDKGYWIISVKKH